MSDVTFLKSQCLVLVFVMGGLITSFLPSTGRSLECLHPEPVLMPQSLSSEVSDMHPVHHILSLLTLHGVLCNKDWAREQGSDINTPYKGPSTHTENGIVTKHPKIPQTSAKDAKVNSKERGPLCLLNLSKSWSK